jgi:hypothetical protein
VTKFIKNYKRASGSDARFLVRDVLPVHHFDFHLLYHTLRLHEFEGKVNMMVIMFNVTPGQPDYMQISAILSYSRMFAARDCNPGSDGFSSF